MNLEFVQKLLDMAAAEYARQLEVFSPCNPGGEFDEANITALVAEAFKKTAPASIAFFNVPFLPVDNSNTYTPKMDGYFACSDYGIAVASHPLRYGADCEISKLAEMEQDIAWMQSARLRRKVANMRKRKSCDDQPADKVYGLILADCWSKRLERQWLDNENQFAHRFAHVACMQTCSAYVGNYAAGDYFLLAGLLPNVAKVKVAELYARKDQHEKP